jgi:hypothetical protein
MVIKGLSIEDKSLKLTKNKTMLYNYLNQSRGQIDRNLHILEVIVNREISKKRRYL